MGEASLFGTHTAIQFPCVAASRQVCGKENKTPGQGGEGPPPPRVQGLGPKNGVLASRSARLTRSMAATSRSATTRRRDLGGLSVR